MDHTIDNEINDDIDWNVSSLSQCQEEVEV